MDFASNVVGTEAPNLEDFGLPSVNALEEVNIFSNPANRIIRAYVRNPLVYSESCSGKATVVGMSATRSELDYSYKTDFQNWKENQYFGRQNILMSQPPLDSTTIDTNTTDRTMSQIELIPIKKTPEITPQTQPTESSTRLTELSKRPTDSSKRKGKLHVPADPDSEPSLSELSPSKYNFLTDINYSKPEGKKHNKKKNSENTRNRTCQIHHQAIMIRPTTVTIDVGQAKKRKATGKRILSNYAQG